MSKETDALQDFLRRYPHLIPMQMEIDKNLSLFDNYGDRCNYIAEELSGKINELLSEFKELGKILGE